MTLRPDKTALCTLNRVIQRLNADSSSINVSTTVAQTTQINTESANFKAEMVKCIYKASDLIEQATNNTFIPFLHTQTWKGNGYRRVWDYDRITGEYILKMPDSLLSVTSLTFAGTAMDSADYYTRFEGKYPAREIAIYSDTTFTLPSSSDQSIALVAVWGYHRNPSAMWADSAATVQSNPLSSSATTLTVSSATNFEILQYIKVDSEYMLVTAMSGTTLTIERGVRGTTAASHTQNTAIYIFVPIEDVADECARLAIRRYQLRSGLEIVATGETAFELKMGDVDLSNSYKRYYIGSG